MNVCNPICINFTLLMHSERSGSLAISSMVYLGTVEEIHGLGVQQTFHVFYFSCTPCFLTPCVMSHES